MDLSGNFVGQDGVMYIASALMNNNTLKILNLSSNNITDDQELYGRTLLTPIPSKSNLSTAPSNPVGAGGLVVDMGNGRDAASVTGAVTSSSMASGIESGNKSKTGSKTNIDEDNSNANTNANTTTITATNNNNSSSITDEITTSTLSYLAEAVSREESAITHLDLRGNNIGNNGGEIMLQALKNRKALVAAKKKTAPVFICQVTERMKSDIFSKIFDINKYMLEQEKKRGGKKKGKKGKKGKKVI